METFYLIAIILLFLLAVFDLYIGVSNDAVNFLNSAIGSKAANFKTILFIAALGIFTGAVLSNGMMDVARHGIFQPQYFYFSEIMCILMAVMLADVVLLDIFNALGLPTSTTVSMVFDLLGGTFALALIKISNSNGALNFGDLINTEKALTIIIGIFLSVAIAFFFGTIVQYITRLIFGFNYTKNMKYFIGVFGGISATAIVYFMIINGLKAASFMTDANKLWVKDHSVEIVFGCLAFFTVLMQLLHWLKINVFKVIVLLGTFSLALAFAGNDLVNFIGVPLAGLSAYQDYTANGGGSPDTFLMTTLLESARTNWYFLTAAGGVMIFALYTSKKAHHVIKTAVDLSRQEEGTESFGTSPVARSLVRSSNSLANTILLIVPEKIKKWIDSRFNKDVLILENEAAFDLVRASVNLVLSGLLIAVGTSMKLPLSTTYVTFMVAMGSSLSDRAWGRESAVYRITGVLSVIGGWFITAGVAFVLCFLVTLILYYGGIPGTIATVALAAYALVRNQISFKNKQEKDKTDPIIARLMNTKDTELAFALFREHTRDEEQKILKFAEQSFGQIIEAFLNENLRQLRKQSDAIEDGKDYIKKDKRIGTLGMRRLDTNTAIEKGGYYYQGNDFAYEIIKSLERLCEPCLEHIDNNFNPLADDQKEEFSQISQDITLFLTKSQIMVQENNYDDIEQVILDGNTAINKLMIMKKGHLERIRSQACSAKVGMVYLTMIQEAQNISAYTINLLKVSRKFQTD